MVEMLSPTRTLLAAASATFAPSTAKVAVFKPVDGCAKSDEGNPQLQEQIAICQAALEKISGLREDYRPKFRYEENQIWADAYVQQKYGFLRILIAQKEFRTAGETLTKPVCAQFSLAKQHFASIPSIADEREWFGEADLNLRNMADRITARCAAGSPEPMTD
ncbi:hypothetical protein [Pontixanthobacter sp. CEM42]|uniref:hypothetical protein n=1 Tax=Pontixanthobacter sp. CEM42 TaxID=2792077 RepID=UPI001AE0D913|nr:hypothetical protein [Pontixanthobacter sp. CEM42]